MSETCPSCQKPASGRFCNHCGAALAAGCRECGNPLPAGAHFCNQCGAPAAAAPVAAPRASWIPWTVAGAALVILAGVLVIPRLGGEGGTTPPPASGSAPGGPAGSAAAAAPSGNAAAVDLGSMSPREAADRLFNRVMQNVSGGDTAQARTFLPMAIAAYERVGDLDTDGRYHLAVLHLVNGDAQAARTEADAILTREARHLFGLFTAAQAETQLGNSSRALELYERFLSAYETERARDLPEYRDHQQALAPMREEARRIVDAN